ncbi:MAG TPA: branched-chain amino acid ABC transporter substrate-binding protein [Acidimicrobiales bacterium]|nr:branched-chain amino acid ABC transporter substrate-binding protein [Acidimicrobiales bacterium]
MVQYPKARAAAAALVGGGLLATCCALLGTATTTAGATPRAVAAHATAPRATAPRTAAASCAGSVGVEAPITGAVAVIGLQQLHWAEYAATLYNAQHHSDFKVVSEDTEFEPAQATVVTQDLVSNASVLDVVGPSSSAEVEAVGPIMASNHLAFISASATADNLFTGKYPTFFSVVADNAEEGPYDATFIAKTLGAKHVEVVDDESGYSVELASLAEKTFTSDHVGYTTAAVSQTDIDYAAVIAKIPADVTAVYLPWQVAGNAELFAQQLVSAHRHLVIVGSDGVSSPSEFYAPGDYVTAFSPDITQSAADATLIKNYLATYHGSVGTYGPPEFVAMQAALSAISTACKSGAPTRAAVLAAVRKTDLPTSLEGVPITFNKDGLLGAAKFYIFKVENKKYVEVG